VSEWQPIETAPRDGTIILVYPDINVSYWGYTKDDDCPHGWIGRYCYTVDNYDTINPTHWMPIPDPPRATA